MLHRKPRDPVLEALLLKRVQVYTWLEGPVEQADLAAINRAIEKHRQQARVHAA